MASCSSSSRSSLSPKKYDVFISFRGEDTRSNFTSHLHAALCRHNIETYIDYRLEKGDEVWPSLVKAIEDSTLFLVVFSENYASSTWCLNELTKILECSKEEGRHAIPVFYNIDPSHIRKQTGTYEIELAKHEQSNHQKHVPRWRATLTEAANLSGWDSSTFTNEVDFIGAIVKDVLKKLRSVEQSGYLDGLIGIHEQIVEVESLMCNDSQDVRFIGITGMGGIGKTTISKALFNKLCLEFESFCFLANVREEAQKYGIVHLKNKLLSILLEDKESYTGMLDGESIYIQRRLGRKKILVVLDDVNDVEQLTRLAGARHWFGKGSRIIITTRDKQVLGKNVDDIYEVRALEFGDALQLFNSKAFKTNHLDEEFERLTWRVVVYAQGIPLAITVLGSFLCGRVKEEWKSQLKKLNKMPHLKVHQILKLSYDELDYEEKNILLDLACFFKGKHVEHIKLVLDAYGYSTIIGLKSLQDKSLITISNGSVSMHDLIQEMGLEIVREESLMDPGKQSRLWDANDIYQVMKHNKGSDAIKGIRLDMSKMKGLNLSPEVFAKMQNLMFLEFYHSNYSERHSLHLPLGLGYLSDELRYLRWDSCPLKTLPFTFSAENLVQLEMPNSGMRKLWQGVQNVVNLRIINLQNCMHLTEIPDLSKAKNLEEVRLRQCVSLCHVHPSILSLDNLQVLELSNCVALTSLKSDNHLRSLSYLYLDGCSNLMEFSVASENVCFLNLEGTAVNELPPFMKQMLKLNYLFLSDCVSLTNIESNLFDGLQSLRKLRLNGCHYTSEVIQHISMLSSLESLLIKNCRVWRLPRSMKHLHSLRFLTIKNCENLWYLPQLPALIEELHVIDCPSLKIVAFPSTVLPPINECHRLFATTSYQNCLKVDKHSIESILANSLFRLDQYLSQMILGHDDLYSHLVRVMYPGSRVPEWFKYRTTHASITVDLSSAPFPMNWTLLYCVVAPPYRSDEPIWVDCTGNVRFINENEVDANIKDLTSHFLDTRFDIRNLTSDHVCLRCSSNLHSLIYSGIKDGIVTYSTKILLELNFDCYEKWPGGQRLDVKGCGVCPTYTSEYQNFIEKLKMMSEDRESDLTIVRRKHNSSYAIFPPLPPPRWKE